MKSLGDAGTVEELRRRLAAIVETDARQWGSMSSGEMVCHLRGAFRLALGEVASAPVPQKVPRGMIKLLALWAPARWPQGLATVAELERGGAGMERGLFAADHAGLMEAFDRFVARRENRTAHPIFGGMRPREWMRWGYLHTDHHLRQFGR